MAEPLGFLSYTRRDDQFFGGYITAFREALEAGVQVVTGDRGFRLFQDVEGIVIGEQWEKKLAEVIGRASFFLPMLSPLFLSSPNCREEVELFVGREGALGRDDMILPIYLVDSPKLEKAEERDARSGRRARSPSASGTTGARTPGCRWTRRRRARRSRRSPGRSRRRSSASQPCARQPRWPGGRRRLKRREATTAGRADRRRRRRRASWRSPASARCCGSTTARRTTSGSAPRWSPRHPLHAGRVAPARPRRYGARAVRRRSSRTSAGRATEGGLDLLHRLRGGGPARRALLPLYQRSVPRRWLGRVEGAQGVTADPDELVAMVVAAVR